MQLCITYDAGMRRTGLDIGTRVSTAALSGLEEPEKRIKLYIQAPRVLNFKFTQDPSFI